jgi:hypothetical protein
METTDLIKDSLNHSQLRGSRRGLTAHMTACKPYSREEQDFIKAFANMLSHATAVVAANPEIAVPAGSIAHQIREAYSRFRPKLRPAIQERAKARLAGSPELRRRYFGAYADLGPQAWAHATPGLSSEMKQQLRRAVRARLDAQKDKISSLLAAGASSDVLHGPFLPSKTTLVVGYFVGDAANSWTTLTINSPATTSFGKPTRQQQKEESGSSLELESLASRRYYSALALQGTRQAGSSQLTLATTSLPRLPQCRRFIESGSSRKRSRNSE